MKSFKVNIIGLNFNVAVTRPLIFNSCNGNSGIASLTTKLVCDAFATSYYTVAAHNRLFRNALLISLLIHSTKSAACAKLTFYECAIQIICEYTSWSANRLCWKQQRAKRKNKTKCCWNWILNDVINAEWNTVLTDHLLWYSQTSGCPLQRSLHTSTSTSNSAINSHNDNSH